MGKYIFNSIGWGLVAGFLLLGMDCGAQTVLTLDSCIQRALEANYSIQIVRNQQLQAENNVTAGPFLPTVTLNASQDQTISNGKVESMNGTR